MSWFKKFLSSIGDMFTSKKFIAAAATAASQALLSGQSAKGALIAGAGYVLAQGAADFGKSAKQ